MATERRWRRQERDARIANRFEREPARGGQVTGMVVNRHSEPRPDFTQAHLQEAFELGRRHERGR